MSLFRVKIDPRCDYCWHGLLFPGGVSVGCTRHGVMSASARCRNFLYDPFKRVPPKPVKLRKDYTEADFQI